MYAAGPDDHAADDPDHDGDHHHHGDETPCILALIDHPYGAIENVESGSCRVSH